MRKPDLPDLDSMQFDELWTIHEELTRVLSDRILGEKRELEKRLAKLNQTEPTAIEPGRDNRQGGSLRRKYPKVLPKYFNPLSPTETWSGRGKRPRWLVAALQTGQTLEEFSIKETVEDGDHETITK